ncbi:DUF3883 domain-containing protein [uncultured Flavobacterium sp.]|uniref:DUF3883 domain-containing protein n=1 Tax=uncultured Flavobacterium sp. TaxID=165435 RepID=UPI0027E1EDEE|nr:DUF3883 domain-containing protein [uncultured Flavobacterium sp.]
MEPITKQELELINSLYSRSYSNNTIISNASNAERDSLLLIRRKLKSYANYFSNKYQLDFGPFETEMSTGNPVGQSTTLNNVWAGLFKGNTNKQYAAQISFVINRFEACLDVGFYFGRASARSITADEKRVLETQFLQLGKNLSFSLNQNKNLEERYNSLFDFGFKASIDGNPVSPLEWRTGIAQNPQSSQITAKIYPNDFNIIESSTIDSFVAQVIFLMGFVNRNATASEIPPPINPEQYIKKAERYAEIGSKGELFILEKERKRLEELGFLDSEYPRHVALESSHFGYDILSKNDNGEEIFIEVKSTTRTSDDVYSRQFFLTNHEYETYNKNKKQYKLIRVYDVENLATIEYIDMETAIKKTNGYIIEY